MIVCYQTLGVHELGKIPRIRVSSLLTTTTADLPLLALSANWSSELQAVLTVRCVVGKRQRGAVTQGHSVGTVCHYQETLYTLFFFENGY